jgi:hypothetical protein
MIMPMGEGNGAWEAVRACGSGAKARFSVDRRGFEEIVK